MNRDELAAMGSLTTSPEIKNINLKKLSNGYIVSCLGMKDDKVFLTIEESLEYIKILMK